MISPFQFGKSVQKEVFTNRQKEIRQLTTNFMSGINTILISPRRVGKSSLVIETVRKLSIKNKKILYCFIDLLAVRSEEAFYEKLATEVIKVSSSKVEEWIAIGQQFLKRIRPRFSFSNDPLNDFSVSFDVRDIGKNKGEILNLPEAIAKKKKVRFVICIDEFQNISNFNDYESFENTLRAYWQHHKLVTYCIYGSKRHLMSSIFNTPGKPFYRFGEIILLQKIEVRYWKTFICNAFTRTCKFINPEQAETIANTVKCHPYYVQQLAYNIWRNTPRKVTDKIIKFSVEELLRYNAIFYQKEVEILSNTQINFLKAVVAEVKHYTSVKTMNDYKLGTPRNVIKNRITLEGRDIIDLTESKIEFLDPVFEMWFREHFV